MKKALLPSLLLAIVVALGAEESSLYTYVSGSTLYLRHEVLLDPVYAKDQQLVKKLEGAWKKPLLNTYQTLSSGSGFIITQDGMALTNRHVVLLEDQSAVRRAVANDLAREFDELKESDFTKEEKRRLKLDFYSMLTKGAYRFSATLGERTFDAATVFAAEKDDPDIALVRISGRIAFPALAVAPTSAIDQRLIGKEVFSFGYPLGVTMDQAFKDRVVTMNKGNISALRKDNLGIQHSAAISGGNSGGPLVDANGLVVGMNSAEMRQGNSLFLAVGADLIRDYLGRKGFAGLFDASVPPLSSGAMAAAVPLPASAGVRLNALGEIECSADVLIDAEKGASIYFDGARIGVAPLITTLSKPITELEIRGEMGAFSGKLRLLQSLSGLTAVKPALVPYRTEVIVTSEPAGAEVAEDGKVLGTTPLRLEMSTGEHAFDLTLQGYFFDPVRMVAKRSAPGSAHAVGSKLIPVAVRNMKTETAVKLTFRSGSRELAFGSDQKIALPAGDWRLTVPEIAWLNGVEIPVAVASEPVVVDAAAFALTGTVQIAELGPNSRVWLNGSELSDPTNPLRLPLGPNTLYCWEDGRLPLPEAIVRVKPDETLTVQWPKVPGNEVRAKRYGRTGLIMALVGAAVIAHGAYNNLNEVATEKASSYDDYRAIKDRTKAEIYIGGSVVVVSALMDLIGLGYHRSYVAQRKFRDGLGGAAE